MQREEYLPAELWSEILSNVGSQREYNALASVSQSTTRGRKGISNWSFTERRTREYNGVFLSDVDLHLLDSFLYEEQFIEAPNYQTAYLTSLIYCVERYKALGESILIILQYGYQELLETARMLNIMDKVILTSIDTVTEMVPGVYVVKLNDISKVSGLINDFDLVVSFAQSNRLPNKIRSMIHHIVSVSQFALLSLVNETTRLKYRSLLGKEVETAIKDSPGRVLVIVDTIVALNQYEHPQTFNDLLESKERVVYRTISEVKPFIDTHVHFYMFDSFVLVDVDFSVVFTIGSLCMQAKKSKYLTTVSTNSNFYSPFPIPSRMAHETREVFELGSKPKFSICGLSYIELLVVSSNIKEGEEMWNLKRTLTEEEILAIGYESYNEYSQEEIEYDEYDLREFSDEREEFEDSFLLLAEKKLLEDGKKFILARIGNKIERTDGRDKEDCWIVLDPLERVTDIPQTINVSQDREDPVVTEIKRKLTNTLQNKRGDADSYTVLQLKTLLEARNLETKGTRKELAERLLSDLY